MKFYLGSMSAQGALNNFREMRRSYSEPSKRSRKRYFDKESKISKQFPFVLPLLFNSKGSIEGLRERIVFPPFFFQFPANYWRGHRDEKKTPESFP